MELITEFALDIAKRTLRASTIMHSLLKPHAYIPMEFDREKILEAIKELGYEGEIPEPPEEMDGAVALAKVPLNFSNKKDSLFGLGTLMAVADVSKVLVICDMSVDIDGDDIDVLCVADIDLKDPDTMIMIPYVREPEDVAFGEWSVTAKVDEDIRDNVVEGFLTAESKKFLDKNPEADTDSYVDELPSMFPNVEGALNSEEPNE